MIYNIIKKLASDDGKKIKENVLNENKYNETLKRVFFYTSNPNFNYQVKDLSRIDFTTTGNNDINFAFPFLDKLIKREVTGNKMIEDTIAIGNQLTAADQIVFKNIIEKNQHCGVSYKTLNKVWKNLIPTTPYMGAKPFSKKLLTKLIDENDYVEANIKIDGRYVNIICEEDNINMISRQGKDSNLPKEFHDIFKDIQHVNKNYGESIVFNGEIVIENISRYKSNGIVNSLVKINSYTDETKKEKSYQKLYKEHGITIDFILKNIKIKVWDFIPYKNYMLDGTWDVERKERLELLTTIFNRTNMKFIELIEYKMLKTYEEVVSYFSEVIMRGEEGLVVKGMNGIWENKKPNHQIKMKLEFVTTLEMYDIEEGEGKLKGMVGSIFVKSSDNKLYTKVGGNSMSREKAKEYWENWEKYKGEYIDVKCSGLSHDKDNKYALLHPRYKCERDDTTCDTLNDIKNIQNMKLGLTKNDVKNGGK